MCRFLNCGNKRLKLHILVNLVALYRDIDEAK